MTVLMCMKYHYDNIDWHLETTLLCLVDILLLLHIVGVLLLPIDILLLLVFVLLPLASISIIVQFHLNRVLLWYLILLQSFHHLVALVPQFLVIPIPQLHPVILDSFLLSSFFDSTLSS